MGRYRRNQCPRPAWVVGSIRDFSSVESDGRRAYSQDIELHLDGPAQCIAIGPNSSFDACLLKREGIIVSRKRPFIGEVDVSQLQVEPLIETRPNTILGKATLTALSMPFIGDLQLQAWNYIPPFVPTCRAPLEVESDRAFAATTGGEYCLRACVRGRDEIAVNVRNEDTTDSGTWNLFGYTFDGDGVSEFDITPDTFGTLATSAGEQVVIASKPYDAIAIFATADANTMDFHARIKAYDR